MLSFKNRLSRERRLLQIPPTQISPSPDQPRRSFDEYELTLLRDSIKQNGLLQPVSVRRVQNGYELIAGERRVRASIMAGLQAIPAIVYDISSEEAAVYTLIENLQREDLSPFDEAEGIRRLISVYGVTQCDAAERLGLAQSTLSNKLRILKLSEEQRRKITASGLTERHARALLRVEPQYRDDMLDNIIANGLTVKQAEQLSEEYGREPAAIKKPLRRGGIGDIRLFANSLSKIVDTMSAAGYTAAVRKKETDSFIEYTVKIEKQSPQMRLI